MKIFRLLLIKLILLLIITLIACDKSSSIQSSTEQSSSNPEIAPASTATKVDISLVDERLADPKDITDRKAVSNPTPTPVTVPMQFENSGPWINPSPFTSEGQQNGVVLVDFWTYSCVNCIRTLPHLKEWHSKYEDQGLTIIGVHSPEFEFEKIPENVSIAVKEFGVEYPVVLDNDLKIWKSFSNRYWPAKYLLDKDGIIRYTHFGEGQYQETESAIRMLLTETGVESSMLPEISIALTSPESSEIPRSQQTMELYLGTDRNYAFNLFQQPYIGNEQYYENIRSNDWQKEANFKKPSRRKKDRIYLTGLWLKEKESILHGRNTDDYTDFISLIFSATEVNVVLGKYKEPYKVMITLENNPLKQSEAGTDVDFDQSGNSFILVNDSKMYNIIKLKTFDTRDLKLSSNSIGFSVYSFTFGSDPRKQ